MRAWSVGDVAEKWKQQYLKKDGTWSKKSIGDSEAIYGQIVAANGNVDAINAAIGNDSWTRFICVECQNVKTVGIIIDNGDGASAELCRECLQRGLELCANAD